ncbi:MAG TPA: MFS transporter, partial [Phycisphaerae bacterium]|nr:MFS transporter [Phycisphaerae bacterium]
VRSARRKFASMAGAYAMGVFNDSLYRQSAILLALAGSSGAIKEGWILTIFTVPYLLLASTAGWLADRFPKRRIIIAAKALELVAMGLGAVGICLGSWPLILAMAFAMGMQSCLFGPSLNGSIPELYPAAYVQRANSILKVVVTPMILAGLVAAGFALHVKTAGAGGIPVGRWIVGIALVAVSTVGLLFSVGSPRRPAADPGAPFPWLGPIRTIVELWELRKDRLLAIASVASVFIWFVGSMLILLISVLVMDQLQAGEAISGSLLAAQVVGVAIGGVLSNVVASGPRWYRALAPSAAGLGAVLLAMGALPSLPTDAQIPVAFVLLGLTGILGGIFMIPCGSFIQVRAPIEKRGTIIASVSFATFAAISLSGLIEWLLIYSLGLATSALAAVGVLAIGMAIWLRWVLNEETAA